MVICLQEFLHVLVNLKLKRLSTHRIYRFNTLLHSFLFRSRIINVPSSIYTPLMTNVNR